MILVKWQFFFKTLSNENSLSYWLPLGLEWKIFCHSLLIFFHFWVGCCSLSAIMMIRCPYIYFQDSKCNYGMEVDWLNNQVTIQLTNQQSEGTRDKDVRSFQKCWLTHFPASRALHYASHPTCSGHVFSSLTTFLVACTRLYTQLCPSVGWLVGWSPFYFFRSF